MTMPCRLCKSCIYKTLLCNKKRATYENLYFATNKNPTNAFDLSKVPKFQMVYENLLQKQNAKAKVTLWLERKFAKANQVSFVGNCVERTLQLCFCEILAFHNLAEKLQNLLKTLEIYGYFAKGSVWQIHAFAWICGYATPFFVKKTAHKGKLKDNLCVLSFVMMIWQRIYTQNPHFKKSFHQKRLFKSSQKAFSSPYHKVR